MKTRIFLIPLIALIVILGNSSSYGQNMKDILNDPEKQKEAFEIISGDHNLMMKFMETVKQNEHSKSMMMEGMMEMSKEDTAMGNMMSMKMMDDPGMMKMMMNNMMNKAEKDSTMGMEMCKMMMEKEKMKGMMENMMKMKKDDNMKHDMNNMQKKEDDDVKNEDNHSKHH